jgi:putative selenium metabolism hydrolase
MEAEMTVPSDCVEFIQRLIRTESMPGEEGSIATLVAGEMEKLGYDEVRIDTAGNVIGLVRGGGEAPSVMFNTHLDHVDVGDPALWPYPPFGAEIADGRVWGRGAVDIKGPLAAQVYGVARLLEGGPPPGDVYVTGVVQEEVGGLGARYLAQRLRTDLVLIGEPSSNQLRRGHRGRVELIVHVTGRSAHASVPHRGANPLTTVGRFLAGLPDLAQPDDPDLGPATIVPTLIRSDQRSANVIPAEVWLTLDCRTVTGQSAEDVRDLLRPLVESSVVAGVAASTQIPLFPRRSYTGHSRDLPADNPAHSLPADHAAIRSAGDAIEGALGTRPTVDIWHFATDGGHFAEAGMTVVGFGPGEETLAHTIRESIALEELEAAVVANEALARDWPTGYADAGGDAG